MSTIRFLRAATRACGVTLFLAILLTSARADVRYFYSILEGAQEVPPVATAASGEGLYTLDDVLSTLDYEITFQDLSSPENGAHFHGPAPRGANAGVLHGLALGSPKIGTWNLTATNITQVDGELVYLNIHSDLHPPGEIRGQIEPVGRGYCFGDGSGTACPCGNSAGPHEGCRNTSGAGSRLRPAGFPTGNGAGLRFVCDGLIPGNAAVLFVGTDTDNGGAGTPFGDGLSCVGGSTVRFDVTFPDGGGRAEWGPGLDVQGGWSPGDTRFFQVWHRDPIGGGVCNNGHNRSNGVEITMLQ